MNGIEIITDPFKELIHDFIKNAPKMTKEAQNAVATYLSYQSAPILKVTGEFPPKPTKSGKSK